MAELNEVMSAVKELREEVSKKCMDSAKVDRINTYLDTAEKQNQELTAKQQEVLNTSREIKQIQEELKELQRSNSAEAIERIKEIEKDIALKAGNGAAGGAMWKNSDEFIAFKDYFAKGDAAMDVKTLRTDTEVQGGYLVNPEFSTEILKTLADISPVRAFARIRTTAKKSLEIPVRNELPIAKYVGESESADDTQPTYAAESLTAYRQTANIPVTLDLLQFGGYNVESEFAQDIATAFALGEGRAFIKGTGHKQPEGILTNKNIGTVLSATAGTLSFDDVLALPAALKSGYTNPIYGFNRNTLYKLRTAKDSGGNYLWRIGGETMPSKIGDYNYAIFDDMPNVANNSTPVMFGDLYSGYMILDSTQMGLIRDEYTHKKKAIVEMTWHRWNTGQVVMPEAIKLLKIKA